MKVFLLTLFPRALESYFETSIMQKAQQQWLLELHICNIADFSVKATRRADDRPYGWFAGTILAPEPCSRAMDDCISKNGGPIEWIAPDPRGEPLCQNTLW
jgi:tRNA (guanine37-N1)-methyltransferase